MFQRIDQMHAVNLSCGCAFNTDIQKEPPLAIDSSKQTQRYPLGKSTLPEVTRAAESMLEAHYDRSGDT